MTSLQPNKVFKVFSSKLYKIIIRFLNFLIQNIEPFITTSLSRQAARVLLPLATTRCCSLPRGAAQKGSCPKDRRRRRSPSGSCQPERSASHVHLGQQAAPRRTTTSSASIVVLVLGEHRRSTPCPRLVPQHRPARRVYGSSSGIHLGE